MKKHISLFLLLFLSVASLPAQTAIEVDFSKPRDRHLFKTKVGFRSCDELKYNFSAIDFFSDLVTAGQANKK